MWNLSLLLILMFFGNVYNCDHPAWGRESELVYMLLVHLYVNLACDTFCAFLLFLVLEDVCGLRLNKTESVVFKLWMLYFLRISFQII